MGASNVVAAVPPAVYDVELMIAPSPEGVSTIAAALSRAGFKPTEGVYPREQADQLRQLMCESTEEVGVKYGIAKSDDLAANLVASATCV